MGAPMVLGEWARAVFGRSPWAADSASSATDNAKDGALRGGCLSITPRTSIGGQIESHRQHMAAQAAVMRQMQEVAEEAARERERKLAAEAARPKSRAEEALLAAWGMDGANVSSVDARMVVRIVEVLRRDPEAFEAIREAACAAALARAVDFAQISVTEDFGRTTLGAQYMRGLAGNPPPRPVFGQGPTTYTVAGSQWAATDARNVFGQGR